MTDKNHSSQAQDDTVETHAAIAQGGLLHHLRISVIATLLLSVLCCGVYPAIVWGLSQAIFHDKANGSLIKDDGGAVIGSRLIGQNFTDAKYFHGRPSAAGSGYDATASGGSNLGPTSAKLLNGTTKPSSAPITPAGAVVDFDGIKLRLFHYCDDNSIAFEPSRGGKAIPMDAFTKEFKGSAGWDEVKLILAFNDTDHPLALKAMQPVPSDTVTASASGLDPHISIENAIAQSQRVAEARRVPRDKVLKLIADCTDGRDLGLFGEVGVNVLMLNRALDKR